MQKLVTPFVSIFFLAMCFSGPHAVQSVVSGMSSPNKTRQFHEGLMISIGILLMIIALAAIVYLINKMHKGQRK